MHLLQLSLVLQRLLCLLDLLITPYRMQVGDEAPLEGGDDLLSAFNLFGANSPPLAAGMLYSSRTGSCGGYGDRCGQLHLKSIATLKPIQMAPTISSSAPTKPALK